MAEEGVARQENVLYWVTEAGHAHAATADEGDVDADSLRQLVRAIGEYRAVSHEGLVAAFRRANGRHAAAATASANIAENMHSHLHKAVACGYLEAL